MRVLADFHHSSLYESLLMLFEDRFGWEVFRPIGQEWFTEGYWKLAEPYGNHPSTIDQFLGMRDFVPPDGTPSLNNDLKQVELYYTSKDNVYGRYHKLVTLNQFKAMQFDILLSTYAPHYKTFHDLLQFQSKAKHVCQAGNNWLDVVDWSICKNMMASCAVPAGQIPAGVNWVSYHQEFSRQVFPTTPYKYDGGVTISSFVNALHQWPQVIEEIEKYESWFKEEGFDFKMYGASNREGVVTDQQRISHLMQGSTWGWHVKPGGDGYGHVIHNWAAIGRPLIVHRSQYRGQLADALLEDGKTCIDLDVGDFSYNRDRLQYFSNQDVHFEFVQNMIYRFNQVVNFDKEYLDIFAFLSRLI